MIEVDAELLTVRVTEGLTEDAVCARLHEGGLAPPLYVHVPPPSATSDARLSEATAEGEWGRRVAAIFRSEIGAVARYGGSDAVGGMVEEVRKQLALPSGAQFRVVSRVLKVMSGDGSWLGWLLAMVPGGVIICVGLVS